MMARPDLKELKNVATILFDDGYKDNIGYAAPILAKYKAKASFYVVTESIDKNIPTWTHILEYCFQYTKKTDINLIFNFLPIDLQVTELSTEGKRIEYVKKLKPFLKTISHQNRNMILDRVRQSFNDVDLPRIMMDWQDLLKLTEQGHYIGSHTVSHCMLGTMSDPDEIRNELLISGQMIEKHLGYFPKTISYPVGSYSQTVINLSKEVGYTIGLAVKQRPYYPAKDDIFEIPRIELYNENWFKTKLRITNILEDIKAITRYNR